MKLLLLRGAPQRKHTVLMRSFIGPEYDITQAALAHMGIDLESCYIEFAQQHTASGVSAAQVPIKHAQLMKRLEEIKPDKILVMGNVAYQILTNSGYTNAYRVRGKAWIQKIGNHQAYAVACLDPQEVIDDPTLYRDFHVCIEKWAKNTKLCPAPNTTRWTVDTFDELREAISFLLTSKEIIFDVETTALDPHEGVLTAIGLCVKDAGGYTAITIPHALLYDSEKTCKNILKNIFTNSEKIFVAHNAKFDLKWLAYYLGTTVHDMRINIHDTMLMHYVLDERTTQKPGGIHGLKLLSQIYFDAPDYEIDFKQSDYLDSPEKLHDYLSKDLVYTYLLYELLKPKLEKRGLLAPESFYRKLLLEGTKVLADIENIGVVIDRAQLSVLREQLSSELDIVIKEIRALLDDTLGSDNASFNPGSPKQLKTILDRFGVGDLVESTDRESLLGLQRLKSGEPCGKFCELVLKYRDFTKILSTYVKQLLERSEKTGRIRTNFNLNGTATGRLSSSDPNLQNIPRGHGAAIRNAFTVPLGYTFVNADYSQLEIRVAAALSNDSMLIQAYRDGRDIHREVASKIFKVNYDIVTPEQRSIAKRLVFGILYGISAYGMVHVLAEENIYITQEEAQMYIDSFLAEFTGYTTWRKKIETGFKLNQEVASYFGRVRRWPYISQQNQYATIKEAANFPIQSAASDICLDALIRLYPLIHALGGKILFTVHDSISFEIPNEKLDEALRIIKREMEKTPFENVPFQVDITIGERWK